MQDMLCIRSSIYVSKGEGFMKLFLLAIAAVVVFVAASPAMAQGGCVNSPENPTAILAVVGSASGIVVAVRARLASRRAGRR
jgi:XrtJ-associated TM-motif-TM protein